MKQILFVLLLAGAAFTTCVDDSTRVIMSEQGVNIGLVIGLTIMLIAAAYAAGSTTGNASYTIFAKDEAYHLGFSILLLVAFSAVLLFCCTLMSFFYKETFANLYGTTGSPPSQCYAEGKGINSMSSCYIRMMKRDATTLSNEYIKQYIDLLMHSTFSWSVQYPLVDAYTATAGAYRRIVSSQYDIILNTFLVPALMSISMQKLLLDFINENAVRWILPIAFLLRVFIPTRQMGNMMIALVVGLYVVVPFMYVFNMSMYEVTLNDCTPFAQAVCDDPTDSYGCASPATTCTNTFGFWNVARLIPQAFFLPNLTIVVVITFLGCVNKALRVMG